MTELTQNISSFNTSPSHSNSLNASQPLRQEASLVKVNMHPLFALKHLEHKPFNVERPLPFNVERPSPFSVERPPPFNTNHYQQLLEFQNSLYKQFASKQQLLPAYQSRNHIFNKFTNLFQNPPTYCNGPTDLRSLFSYYYHKHPYFGFNKSPSQFNSQLASSSINCISEEPKPTHSYIGIIAMAILNSKDKKLVLSDIYQWILDNYPYFRRRGPGWRNSIRHNLSLNDCFIKSGRSANGKGHYWAVHPANVEDFEKGDFRRRRAQRKVRRAMGLSVPDEEDDSPTNSPALQKTTKTNSSNFEMLDNKEVCKSSIHPKAWKHRQAPDRASDDFESQCFTKMNVQADDKTIIEFPKVTKSNVNDEATVTNNRPKKRSFDMESILEPDTNDKNQKNNYNLFYKESETFFDDQNKANSQNKQMLITKFTKSNVSISYNHSSYERNNSNLQQADKLHAKSIFEKYGINNKMKIDKMSSNSTKEDVVVTDDFCFKQSKSFVTSNSSQPSLELFKHSIENHWK